MEKHTLKIYPKEAADGCWCLALEYKGSIYEGPACSREVIDAAVVTIAQELDEAKTQDDILALLNRCGWSVRFARSHHH